MTLGKFKTFALLACLTLPLVAIGCDDDDPVLGSFAKTSTAVTADVAIPSTPIAAGTYQGTSVALPAAVANALPTGANLSVAPNGSNFATTSETTFDVSAGPTVNVSLNPAGTVLTAPGATLTIPYSPQALVDQGFAADVASLTQAQVEAAVFVTKVSGIGTSQTTEILTPVAGSATLTAPFTVQVAGLTSFSRFQGIADRAPSHTFDADATAEGFQLPAGQFFATYAPVQLTAQGGVGATRKAINPLAANPVYTFTQKVGAELPSGMTLSASGAIAGTPVTVGTENPLVAATKTFTVIVADAAGRTAEREFSIHIAAATIGVITTDSLNSGTVGELYNAQLAVTGPGGTDPLNYVWTIDAGLDGSGLSLSSSGVVEGTPTSTGTFNFTATATDTTTNVTGQPKPLSITVYDPLVINTTALPGGLVGTAYTATIDAAGGRAPLTFAITQGTTPAGITMSAAGVFSGTANTDDPQTFTVTVTDSDTPARSVNQELSIIFNAKPVVTATATGTSGIVDVTFEFTDADGAASTQGYTASFSYSVGGGAATPVKASALDANGNTLNALATGTSYTVKIDTSYSLEGLRLGAAASESVVFSVTVTDNQFSNNGVGTTAAANIDNTQAGDMPASGTHAIIAPRVIAAPNGNFTIEIRLDRNGSVAPDLASAVQFRFFVDTNVFEFDTALNDPQDPGSGFANIIPWNVAAGGVLPNNKDVAASYGVAGPGVLAFVISGGTSTIPTGGIVRINLKVKDGISPTTAALAITDVTMSRPNPAGAIPSAGVSGTLIVE